MTQNYVGTLDTQLSQFSHFMTLSAFQHRFKNGVCYMFVRSNDHMFDCSKMTSSTVISFKIPFPFRN